MAGASLNDIKARIKSVNSTMQITKAMELVATSKLRRAKERVERARPFFEALSEAIALIGAVGGNGESIWSGAREVKKTLYVVIAGDRGLAGGYNANVFRLAASMACNDESALYLPVGKKALEYYKHRNKEIYSDAFLSVADIGVGDSLDMASLICRGYADGEFDRVVAVYTHFTSMISQLPRTEELLPLSERKTEGSADKDPLLGGDAEQILERIVPQYVGGMIYSAVCEALASESGARRMAMNSANKNASEMIDSLMLGYNRARQAVITQEITEIVSGAEAL